MNSPTIRPATVADIPTIQRLARKIWLAHYPGIITRRQIEYMLDLDYSEDALKRDFEGGTSFDLLTLDDEDRGFAAYGPTAHEANVKLHKLYLDTSFHGRGLGSTMLDHVIDVCRNNGFDTLELQVNKQNVKAVKAYERKGFKRVKSLIKPIGDDFFMDDYIMAMPLTGK